jgi:hypothetical protein
MGRATHKFGEVPESMYQVVVVSLCLVFCVGEKVERGLIIIGGWAVRGLCKRQTDHFAPLVHAPKKLSQINTSFRKSCDHMSPSHQ